MRTSTLLCLSLVAAACSSSGSHKAVDPQPHCVALAKSWCERYFECYTPEQIADAGLPRTVDDCRRELELDMQCDAVVPETVCADGYELAPDDASACVGDVRHAVCSQLRAPDEVATTCDAACEDQPPSQQRCDDTPCDPADPDACGPGQACRLDDECTAICSDDVGSGTALDECQTDADCDAGYLCSSAGICTQLCDDGNDCDTGRFCEGATHADAGVQECSDSCIPGRGECPDGMTCGLPDDTNITTYCIDAGAGAEGSSCDADADCGADMLCVTGSGYGYCRVACDSQNPCADGGSCYGFATAVTIRGVTVGYCY